MTNEQIDILRAEWLQTLPKFTEMQWLEILPEGREALHKHLTSELSTLKLQQAALLEERRVLNQMPLEATFLAEYGQTLVDEKEKEIVRKIKQATWLLQSISGQAAQHKGITPEDVVAAKRVPLTNFYTGNLRKFGTKAVGLCPFHDEKSPSFTIYLSQNSWWCYAESTGGDVIDYIQKLQNLDFPSAVKFLVQK